MSKLSYNFWCDIANKIRNSGKKVFEGNFSTRYEMYKPHECGALLVEDSGYTETVTWEGKTVLLNHGTKTARLLEDLTENNPKPNINPVLRDISEKIDSDISATETILKNLEGDSANEKSVQFYTGRLAYMRELQSHILYISKERS